jgi:uncharacterized membrane protein
VDRYDPYWQAGHHGTHPLAWLLFFVLLALIVAAAVWLVLRLAGRRPLLPVAPTAMSSGPQADGALETLRLRYARGEIDRDEFLRVSGDLGAAPPTG